MSISTGRYHDIAGVSCYLSNEHFNPKDRFFEIQAYPNCLFMNGAVFDKRLGATLQHDADRDPRLTPDDIAMLTIARSVNIHPCNTSASKNKFWSEERCTLCLDADVSSALVDLRVKRQIFNVLSINSRLGEVRVSVDSARCLETHIFENGVSFCRRRTGSNAVIFPIQLSILDIDAVPPVDLAADLIDIASNASRPWYRRLYPELDLPSRLQTIKNWFVSGELFDCEKGTTTEDFG